MFGSDHQNWLNSITEQECNEEDTLQQWLKATEMHQFRFPCYFIPKYLLETASFLPVMMPHKSLLQLSCWSNICVTTGITGLTTAFLVDEKATEGPHDLRELKYLKWYIKKKSHSKYLSLKVISVFLYKHFALAEAVWTLSKIYKILSQNLVSCCTVWFLQELKRQRFFNKVGKLLLPAGEKTQTVGFSLMLPPCFPPLLCLGLESVL